MATLGRRNTLSINRESTPGLYLDGGALGEILLPARYIPHGLKQGQKLDVFVYRDSEDRLVATTEIPLAMVGEFACLKVVSLNERVGAFLDWGLAKDLLLPFREQEAPIQVGQKIVVAICLDPKTNRIIASARLKRFLNPDEGSFRPGQEAVLLVTSESPLVYNVIVDNLRLGLLYRDSLPGPLQIGQKLQGFVRNVRPGGKLDVSLDKSGYKRVQPLTEKIVRELERHGGRLGFDDNSAPEAIRDKFGVSKKAFKQALGALYKNRRIRFLNPGIQLLDNSTWKPGE